MKFLLFLSTSLLFANTMQRELGTGQLKTCDTQNIGSPDGTWRGRSICVSKASGCHDEEVIYRITHEKGSDDYQVSADKIVNGQVVDMGPLVFSYNKTKGILSNETGRNKWQIMVTETQMEGTLMKDNEVFRKITLVRDK